jgi:hypothetical protein
MKISRNGFHTFDDLLFIDGDNNPRLDKEDDDDVILLVFCNFSTDEIDIF